MGTMSLSLWLLCFLLKKCIEVVLHLEGLLGTANGEKAGMLTRVYFRST